MKPGRIILDTAGPIPLEWCWRDDWCSGFDSAYSLLMKFALLNQIPAKDIAKIFVSTQSGKKSVVCNNPNVDLRDSTIFDRDVFRAIFRIPPDQLRAAFLLDLLPTSSLHSSEYLRWCPLCMSTGFYAAVFQIAAAAYCPVHQIPLVSTCRNCRAQIPYRLRSTNFTRPFCCPGCKIDMAPSIRASRLDVSKVHWSARSVIAELAQHFQREEKVLSRKMSLKLIAPVGRGDLIFSKPDEQGYLSRYIGFMTQVSALQGYKRPRHQSPLNIERIERAVRCTRCSTSNPESEEEDESAGLVGPIQQAVYVGKPKFPGELNSAKRVYRSIRRQLWRHELKQHRACIVTACRHLWWRMEGETTPCFCPVAEAYIRWRMQWEGCGTPRYLYGIPEKELHGVVAWLAVRPSPCPVYWSEATRLWVLEHIFSATCLESFREQVILAKSNQLKGEQYWDRHALAIRYDTYWAVAGADTPSNPATVYVRCPMSALPFEIDGAGRAHRANHFAALAAIHR